MDDEIQALYTLDGIITVVDAKHILARLDDEKPEGVENEAVEQAALLHTHTVIASSLYEEGRRAGGDPTRCSRSPRGWWSFQRKCCDVCMTQLTSTQRNAGGLRRPHPAQQDRPRGGGRAGTYRGATSEDVYPL